MRKKYGLLTTALLLSLSSLAVAQVTINSWNQIAANNDIAQTAKCGSHQCDLKYCNLDTNKECSYSPPFAVLVNTAGMQNQSLPIKWNATKATQCQILSPPTLQAEGNYQQTGNQGRIAHDISNPPPISVLNNGELMAIGNMTSPAYFILSCF